MKRILVLIALVALAGCARDVRDLPPTEKNPARVVAGSHSTYNAALLAIDDSLNGVTCYTTGYHTLSCIKVR